MNDLKEEFENLALQWHNETMFLSSGGQENINFKKIVDMGKPVLPFIFEKIDKEDQFSFRSR